MNELNIKCAFSVKWSVECGGVGEPFRYIHGPRTDMHVQCMLFSKGVL